MAKKTSAQTIVNVTGGTVAALLIGFMVIKWRYIDVPPTGCMESYAQVVRFNLEKRDGQPISMIELLARAGHLEQGLRVNANVVKLEGAPTGTGMEVRAGRADATDPASAIGINFQWRPQALRGANSACLRYSVLIPQEFDYSFGGFLPGLYGGALPERSDKAQDKGFVSRMMWTRDGAGVVLAQSKSVGENGFRVIGNAAGKLHLSRGRWTTIEQELVLNAPDRDNGQIRVWVDGELLVDEKKVRLREEQWPVIDGVATTIGFNGQGHTVPAGNPSMLRITAFDLGWR